MGLGSQNIGNQRNMDNYPPKKEISCVLRKSHCYLNQKWPWRAVGQHKANSVVLFWTYNLILLCLEIYFCLTGLLLVHFDFSFCRGYFVVVVVALGFKETEDMSLGREGGGEDLGLVEGKTWPKYTVWKTVFFFHEELRRKEMTLSVYVLKWCYCNDGIMRVLTSSRDRKYWWSHTWMALWKMPN